MEKIFEKSPAFDFGVQITVCRSNDPSIHIDETLTAHAFELWAVQNIYDPPLCFERYIRDLVEDQCAAMRPF